MRNVTSIASSNYFYYYGTDRGEIYFRTPKQPHWARLYASPSKRPIYAIKTDVKSVHALSFVEYELNEYGEPEYSEAFHLRQENDSIVVDKIDEWVAQLLTPYIYIQGEALGVYLPDTKQKGIVYSLEWFDSTQVLDVYGMNYLAINREMADSTIYTITLPSKEPNTFAMDGPIFTRFRANGTPEVDLGDLDRLGEESLSEVGKLNALLPQQLVLTPHHERTYVEFVTLFSDGKNLCVGSAGRDGYVCISDFHSHQQVFKSDYLESLPRCAVGQNGILYFGGDDGIVGVVKKDSQKEWISNTEFIGEESITMIRYSYEQGVLALHNDDEYIIIVDANTFEVINSQQMDDEVKDMVFTSDGILHVLTYGNELFEIII